MDIIPGIQQSIEIVGKLRALSKKVGDADFKMLLADLSSELGDAKLQVANLKSDLADLKTENAKLKGLLQTRQAAVPHLDQHVYRFDGQDGHYCTACFDVKDKKVRVTEMTGPFADLAKWMCPSCHATYG